MKARIAPYKYPRQITFIEELPKTQTGKVQRFRLRELDHGSADDAPRATPASSTGAP